MLADECVFTRLNVAFKIFLEISRCCISSIDPSVLIFFQQWPLQVLSVSHFTFVSSLLSSKVNGIFFAHGFSALGPSLHFWMLLLWFREKSLESLNWFWPKWWLLELAHWQLPFPFLCSLSFYSGAALLFNPTAFETIKQMVFKHVIFLLLRWEYWWFCDITRSAFFFFPVCYILMYLNVFQRIHPRS